MSCSRGDGESRLQTLIHDDATPLKVLLSVLALSMMERVSLSMGEETVPSIRVCRESMATEVTGRTTSVGDSGVAGCTICVTGRIVSQTVSMTTGFKESNKDLRPESVQGRGDEEGEILGLGAVGELEGLLLTQGGLESDFGVMGESVTGSKGERLVAGLGIEGSILDSMGGQELTLKEAEDSVVVSVTGTGAGVNGRGHLSCIDGASGSAKLA